MTMEKIQTAEDRCLYVCTREQAEGWRYHRNPDHDQQDHVIVVKAALADPDYRAIERTIEAIVRRHESLRTRLILVEGVVRQCVTPYDGAIFGPSYRTIRPEEDAEATISGMVELEKRSMKDPGSYPLFRFYLFKMPDHSFYVCLLIHHIISDAWSVAIINREFRQFYQAFLGGKAPADVPLKMQLRDYASWQRKNEEANKENISRYWLEKLGVFMHGEAGKLPWSEKELTVILDRSVTWSFSCTIDALQYSQLLRLAAYHKVSIGALLHGSLQLLFFLLMGKKQALIAMPLVNRYLSGTEEIIGCLGGGFYLYGTIDEEAGLKNMFRAVYIDFLESPYYLIYDHRDVGLDGDILRLHCDVFVNFVSKEMTDGRTRPVDGLGVHEPLANSEYYALTCCVWECVDGLSFVWKYNSRLYSPNTIDRLTECHRNLLRVMGENPDIRVKDLISSLNQMENVVNT